MAVSERVGSGVSFPKLLRRMWRAMVLAAFVCVTTPAHAYDAYGRQQSAARASVGAVDLATLPQTVGIEHQDRVKRFGRLSKSMGVKAPTIDQMQLRAGELPGINFPLPIVRVIFDEKVFFDFNRDYLRAEAQPILNLMAENMRRDVPDAQLLVLGHTDAVGTDQYNIDLSRRRAMTVISSLIALGVNPDQLSAVAIGESQPVAPNETEDGRARNRRVEFMLSAERAANLRLVHKRRIREEYLKLNDMDTSSTQASVEVIAPAQTAPMAEVTFAKVDVVELQKPTVVDVQMRKPKEYQKNSLDEEFTF